MPLTVTTILVLIALIFTLVNGINGKLPLWIAVLFLCLALLIGTLVRG